LLLTDRNGRDAAPSVRKSETVRDGETVRDETERLTESAALRSTSQVDVSRDHENCSENDEHNVGIPTYDVGRIPTSGRGHPDARRRAVPPYSTV
jgi:hypothetical protein